MAVKKEIDWAKVEMYLQAGSTQIRIAESLGINRDTLRDLAEEHYGISWNAFSAAQRSKGEMLLEAKQYQKAMEGHVKMLVWLGKIRLGQKEPEQTPYNAPHQQDIDKDHAIMRLQHQNDELVKKLRDAGVVLEADADQSKAE